jgi:hypothetical protein
MQSGVVGGLATLTFPSSGTAWVPLEEGYYWIGSHVWNNGGSVANIRTMQTIRPGTTEDISFDVADPSGSAWDDIIGYAYDGNTSATPAQSLVGATIAAKIRSNNTAATGGLPSIVLHLYVPITGY